MRREPFTISPLAAILGTVSACTIDYFWLHDWTPPPAGQPALAWVQIGLLVLSVILSYVAGKLLAKKVKNPFDSTPTSLALRGAYLPRVIGRRRIGVLFGWAGNRQTRKEKVDGGKGSLSAGPKQTVYTEDGWQQLCVGPAYALHAIYQSGKVLFQGPITSTSHPSGSTIDLGKEGQFRIFWGEIDQPINTYLGDASRVGLSSRWPGTCYIEWRAKRLGTSATWPVLEYVVEVRTQSTILVNTPAYMEPTRTLTGSTVNIYGAVAGAAGVGYFKLSGDRSTALKPTQWAELVGHTGMADQTVTVRKVDVVTIATPIGLWPDGTIQYSYSQETRVYLDQTIAGTSATGSLQGYVDAEDDGINPAHILAELLFETDGYGLAFDQVNWDLDSLEDLGTLCVTENFRSSIFGQDGQEYRDVIAGMMLDLGVMVPLDPETGKHTFVPVRQPVGVLPVIQGALQTALPEIDVQHGPKAVDKIVFSFSDRLNGYHDMTLGQDDDGQVTYLDVARPQKAQIISTVNFDSANVAVERRALENLAGGAKFELKCNRSCRYILPGTAIYADGFDDVLRVLDVSPDALSGEVQVTVVPDYYGATLSDFEAGQGNYGTTAIPAAVDRQYIIVEVPEYLLGVGEGQTLVIPRVRASTSIAGSDLHLSRDNSTYTFGARDLSLMTGGVFIGSLSDSGFFDDDTSPQVTIAIDADSVLDLSTDTISWRNGRQILVIEDTSGNQEICFLQKVSLVSGTTYTLDGILRARFDTVRVNITPGCRFFILQNDDGALLRDVLLEPEVAIYVKSDPFGNGQVPLSQVVPEAVSLYGKGVRPVPVVNLRMGVSDVSYPDSSDVDVHWAYCTPQSIGSGAGLQGAGNAMADVPPEGDFMVEFLTSGDVVVRTTQVTTNSFTYTAAQRATDFGAEPASLKIRVTQLRGGYSSDSLTQTFVKV